MAPKRPTATRGSEGNWPLAFPAEDDDGNRQMVDILTAVITDGLPVVEAACTEAIAKGAHSADVVLNIPGLPGHQ